MFVNRGIIKARTNRLFHTLFTMLSLRAFAEEDGNNSDVDPDAPKGNSGVINYEDLIAKARKEEKEKQYKAIEKLKGQIDTLTRQHNDDLLAYAGLETKYNDLKASFDNGQSPDVKALQEKVSLLENENKTLKTKVSDFESKPPVNEEEIENRIRQQLQAEYEVRAYKAEKLLEHKEDILVPELVFGETKEQIDESLKKALERSAEIRKSLGISKDTKPQKRTPKTPSNPSISGIQDKEINMEKLATMDVRSPEYAELRKQLGLH